MMARNLFQMSILLDNAAWRERAENLVAAMAGIALKYPTSFGAWLHLVLQITAGTAEIAVVGENCVAYLSDVLHLYLPHKVVMASNLASDAFPLLRGKQPDSQTLIYFCQNYACQQPVTTVEALKSLVLLNNQ